MSLWLLQSVNPCMSYIDNGGCNEVAKPRVFVPDYYEGGVLITPAHWEGTYSPDLLVCPQHYKQRTADTVKFIYDPGDDTLKMYAMLSCTPWPGWDARRYEFSADAGLWLNSDDVLANENMGEGDSAIGLVAYTRHLSMGSYNKIYSTRNDTTNIFEVDPATLEAVTGGWLVNPYTDWTPQVLYSHAIVNRVDGYFVGATGSYLDFWKNLDTTPEKFATLQVPGSLAYLCWESRKYLWLVCEDGTICKVDYTIPRYEMLSAVQNPDSSTLSYAIAFDTKRNHVVVFRVNPAASDGACQHQLDFYWPMVNATHLTAPVPTSSLKTGKAVRFVSHLRGEAGEGISPWMVYASLAAPALGKMLSAFNATELNGRVTHSYQAPDDPGSDTLNLTVTVEEV